ncbi:MAG: DNA-binding protein [Candidatus Nezhaarchaeales archaeon]
MKDVKEARAGRFFIGKLQHGSDLLTAIEDLAEQFNVKVGVFTVIGAVKRACLSYYDQERKRYLDTVVEKPLELLSCVGNISKMEGKTVVHAHVTLIDREGRVYGGHLKPGTQVFLGEIHLQEVVGVDVQRRYDEVTGLNVFY